MRRCWLLRLVCLLAIRTSSHLSPNGRQILGPYPNLYFVARFPDKAAKTPHFPVPRSPRALALLSVWGVSKSPDIGIIEGMSTCPHCQLEDQQVKAGVNPSGSQRYKCKVCDRRYTAEPHEIGYPQAVRDQAVRLYVDGLNFRRIARTLDVNHQSVINWVNAHVAGLPDTPPLAEGRPEVVELDELFTFVGEKRDKPS